jgi:hypothetical protein
LGDKAGVTSVARSIPQSQHGNSQKFPLLPDIPTGRDIDNTYLFKPLVKFMIEGELDIVGYCQATSPRSDRCCKIRSLREFAKADDEAGTPVLRDHSLPDLSKRFDDAQKYTTNGHPKEAVGMFGQIVLFVTLMALDNKQEIAERPSS